MSGRLAFEVVDVFSDGPFSGNPLAVVFGADGLSTDQMQRIAREFNLSETTFPVATATPGADYRLRIFTPAEELPFAGHPSIGSAWLMAQRGAVRTSRVVQETTSGLQPLEVGVDDAQLTGGDAAYGEPLDAATVLAAVGLTANDHDDVAPPRSTGTGVTQVHVLVRPDAVARAAADHALIDSFHPDRAVYVAAWDATTGSVHARMFAPSLGVPEDPATGSAALGFGVFLAVSGLIPSEATTAYTVRQGIEMGRPSRLDCTVTTVGGAVTEATVRGSVHRVATGEIEVP